jgi:hypothetical protein
MTTNNSIDSDCNALAAHTEAIQEAHRTAFGLSVVEVYSPGAIVWMYDHYNTAIILRASRAPGEWIVSTSDADGSVSEYSYKPAWLRPAIEACVFTWPSIA